MTRRLIVVAVVMVLAVALIAAPAVAADGAKGNGAAPPGLHKTPAAANANPHSVCARCHMDLAAPPCVACHGAT